VKLEGKFKLSQNKSATDRNGVINGLMECGGNPALTAAFMSNLDNGQ